MRSALIALGCCVLCVAGLFSQSMPVAFSNSIPRFTIPEGAASGGGGGKSEDQSTTLGSAAVGTGGARSALGYIRLLTELPTATVAGHYETLLVTNGWKVEARQTGAALVIVRFSAGTPSDPLTGLLAVVPFESAKQTMVCVRLVQNRWPWKGGARTSAQNAPGPGYSASFASHVLELPRSVTRAEYIGANGTSNFMSYELRLEAGDGPAALLTNFESQLPKKGWDVPVRLRDRSQAAIRRNSRPDPETDSSEVWMLTTLPGRGEIDLGYLTIQTPRRR